MTFGRVAVRASVDEAALGEQHDDPVERARQRVGRCGDLLPDLFVVAFDPQIALGQPHLRLAVGELMRGMMAHFVAQRGQFGVDVAFVRVARCACASADGTSSPAAADRSADATSRRTRGLRCSTRFGSVIDPSGADAPE